MSQTNNGGEITAKGMLNNALIWHSLYRQNINDLDKNRQVIATYCLLISFEMLLKGYLISINNKYSYHYRLKKECKHDFGSILKTIKKEAGNHPVEIEEIINKYNLANLDMNMLRYPKKDFSFTLYGDYLVNPNSFDFIFDKIKGIIQAK